MIYVPQAIRRSVCKNESHLVPKARCNFFLASLTVTSIIVKGISSLTSGPEYSVLIYYLKVLTEVYECYLTLSVVPVSSTMLVNFQFQKLSGFLF